MVTGLVIAALAAFSHRFPGFPDKSRDFLKDSMTNAAYFIGKRRRAGKKEGRYD